MQSNSVKYSGESKKVCGNNALFVHQNCVKADNLSSDIRMLKSRDPIYIF